MQLPTNLRFDPQAVTSLGRSIDLTYPSNRLAVIASALAALIVAAGSALGAGIAAGPIAAAGAVFISWAIARELDPDHPISAGIAMALSFLAIILLGEASLVLGAGVLLGARMISGTVGASLRRIDIVVLLGVSALLAMQGTAAAGVPILIAGVATSERPARRTVLIAGSIGLVVGVTAALSGTAVASSAEAPSTVWVIVMALATVVAIPASAPRSTTDVGSLSLESSRLTGARIATALTAVIAVAVTGENSVAATAGAALVGVALWRLQQAGRRVGTSRGDRVRLLARRD